MKIYYTCESCGAPIDMIEVAKVDEAKFGFDCLTAEERAEMIQFDALNNSLHVQSLCDACIETLGLNPESSVPAIKYQH
jgi:hypothetical protein